MPRFSETVMQHFQDPQNFGRIEDASRTGKASISGGASFVIYLRIADEHVAEAKFESFGCGVTMAAGSVLTELIEGQAVRECLAMTADQLTTALGGVPPDKRHCPMIAVAALHQALIDLEGPRK